MDENPGVISKMKRTSLIIVAFLGLVTTFAVEADVNAYLGLGIGKADYDDSLWSIEDDANDTGWKIFGGYQFNRHFGLESAWVDLGKVTFRDASIDTKGLAVNGVGSIPIGPAFFVSGKLGVFFWDQETRAGTNRDDETGTDLVWGYGFGARFFHNQLGVRVEWERYESDSDADFISLSTSYHF
jgi:OOP family OmpA-OmpF porin